MKKINLIFILLLGFVFSACGVWTNFTTYFNVYFNASTAMELAEETMKEEKTELFQFRNDPPRGTAKANLTKVIEKSSRILQFHAESDYFDDALYLIGKSFYYQQDYSKSFRKFSELESLPNSELIADAKLWIAKCNFQLRNFEAGLTKLNEVKILAADQENDELLVEAFITEVSFLLNREDYESAVSLSRELIDIAGDDELRAEIAYEMGKIYVKIEDIENAVKLFAEALTYSPTFEIEFYSKFEFARGRAQLGFEEESLEMFEEMRDEDKYKSFYDLIELEIALVYYNREDYDTAMDMFTVIDTTYKKSESVGNALFYKGDIWEFVYGNYDSAKYYYDQTSSNNAPQETKLQARLRAVPISKYLKVSSDLANNLLGIQYLTDSLKFQEDSVKYVRYLDALEEEKAELGGDKETPTDNRRAEGSVNDRRDRQITQGNPRQQNARGNQLQSKIPFVPEPVKPKISADSIQVLNSDLKFQLGNLFFSELNVADSAEYYYQSVINNHSESKILPRAIYALGALYSTLDQNEKADSLFQIIYDNYNDLDIAQDAAKKLNLPYYDEEVDPAAEMFAKAEEKYLSSSIQDAIGDYRMIASSFPESPFAPKALYTVGYIFENELNLMDSAAVVYDSLSSQYETTEYARASKPKLIEWRKIELAKQAVADSIANAEKPVEEQPEISMENTEEKQSETVAESPKIDENLIDESESAVDSSKIEEAIIDEIDESKLTPEELQKLRQERLKKEFLPALKDSLQKKLDPKSKPKVKEKEDQ